MEESEPVDFENQVVPVRTDVGVGDAPLSQIGAGVGDVRLHPLAGEAVLDHAQHLLRDRVARLLAPVAGEECGILELVRPGAHQPVPVDVGGEDQALRVLAPRHQHSLVVSQVQIQFLEFPQQHPEERILRPDHRRLADEVPQQVQEIGECRGIGANGHGIDPAVAE